MDNVIAGELEKLRQQLVMVNQAGVDLYKDSSGNVTNEKTKKLSFEERNQRKTGLYKDLQDLEELKNNISKITTAGYWCFSKPDLSDIKDLPELIEFAVEMSKENSGILERKRENLRKYGEEKLSQLGMTADQVKHKLTQLRSAREKDRQAERAANVNLDIPVKPATKYDYFDNNQLYVETTSPRQGRLTFAYAPERLPEDSLPIWTEKTLAYGTKSGAGAIEVLKHMTEKPQDMWRFAIKIDLPNKRIYTTDPGPWIGLKATNVRNLGRLLERRIDIVKVVSLVYQDNFCWTKGPYGLTLESDEVLDYVTDGDATEVIPGRRETKSSTIHGADARETENAILYKLSYLVQQKTIDQPTADALLEEAQKVLGYKFDFEKQ